MDAYSSVQWTETGKALLPSEREVFFTRNYIVAYIIHFWKSKHFAYKTFKLLKYYYSIQFSNYSAAWVSQIGVIMWNKYMKIKEFC